MTTKQKILLDAALIILLGAAILGSSYYFYIREENHEEKTENSTMIEHSTEPITSIKLTARIPFATNDIEILADGEVKYRALLKFATSSRNDSGQLSSVQMDELKKTVSDIRFFDLSPTTHPVPDEVDPVEYDVTVTRGGYGHTVHCYEQGCFKLANLIITFWGKPLDGGI
jgi:hypothetical protein